MLHNQQNALKSQKEAIQEAKVKFIYYLWCTYVIEG